MLSPNEDKLIPPQATNQKVYEAILEIDRQYNLKMNLIHTHRVELVLASQKSLKNALSNFYPFNTSF